MKFATVTAGLLLIPVTGIAQTVQDPSAQCVSDLATRSDFSRISDKLPVADVRNMTFAMLASEAVPMCFGCASITQKHLSWRLYSAIND
jgi:hypothetical protein